MEEKKMLKKKFTLIILIMFIICLLPVTGVAKIGYVSDTLLLTFRQGPGNSYAVIKTLPSNTPVKILEENNNYYKVELTASNEIGWVDKKFIIFTLPKTLMVDKLKTRNKNLENKITALQESIHNLKGKLSTIEQNFSQTKNELEKSLKSALKEKNIKIDMLSGSEKKYNTLIEKSKNIQKIVKENKQFKDQNQNLSDELASIKNKHRNFFKTAMIKWFLTGAGVLFLGWIIGQSVSSKKQRSTSMLR